MGNCTLCSRTTHAVTSRPETPSISLDDFKVEEVIGKGSFGKVMLVTHVRSQTKYAMKAISKRHLTDKTKRLRALSERRILETLASNFVVKLHYAFQTPTKLFMVLDFVQGGDLFFHLRACTKFSFELAQFYAAEILLALEDLHANYIIYRDLKPENVLIGANGHLKLADFNLAKLVGPDGMLPRTRCGTPDYIAPEILLGQPQSKQLDYWSFGVLLHEMLVGIPPFVSVSVSELFQKILHGEYYLSPELPPAAASVIAWTLEANPADRPQSVQCIKSHPFFSGINWDLLQQLRVDPPKKPQLSGPSDSSHFLVDKYADSQLSSFD